MRLRSFPYAAICCFLLVSCDGADYGNTMRSLIKQTYGADLNGYYFFSFPTDNFGLGTSYTNKANDENHLCDMYGCLGLNRKEVTTDITLKGFADTGEGPALRTETSIQNEASVKLVLGTLLKGIGVDAGLDYKKGVKAEIEFGNGYKRKLDRRHIYSYMETLPANDPFKTGYDNGTLVMTVADFVVDSMKVKMEIDKTLNPTLEAKLSSLAAMASANTPLSSNAIADAVENAAASAGNQPQTSNSDAENAGEGASEGSNSDGDSLKFSLTRKAEGKYELAATRPLIIAILTKKQPKTRQFEQNSDNDWSEWAVAGPDIKKKTQR